jgi:hypothetical protein
VRTPGDEGENDGTDCERFCRRRHEEGCSTGNLPVQFGGEKRTAPCYFACCRNVSICRKRNSGSSIMMKCFAFSAETTCTFGMLDTC